MPKARIALIQMCLAALLTLILLFTAACGTLNINLHTTVNSGGDITQKITLTASGMMGSAMNGALAPADLTKEGWEVTSSLNADSFSLEATKSFSQDEPLSWGSATGEPMNLENTKYTHDGNILFKTYHFETTLQGSPDLSQAGGSANAPPGFNAQQVETLINSMFSMSWSITLPGSIVKTNADKTEGSTGTWNFSYSSLQTDRSILIESKIINWPVIGGIIAAVLIVAGLAVFLVVRSRRARWNLPPSLPGQPLSP